MAASEGVHVRLSDSILERLDEAAAHAGIGRAEWIRAAVSERLATHGIRWEPCGWLEAFLRSTGALVWLPRTPARVPAWIEARVADCAEGGFLLVFAFNGTPDESLRAVARAATAEIEFHGDPLTAAPYRPGTLDSTPLAVVRPVAFVLGSLDPARRDGMLATSGIGYGRHAATWHEPVRSQWLEGAA